jgi:coenzyme PQQ synthesis protein D (PqqD)
MTSGRFVRSPRALSRAVGQEVLVTAAGREEVDRLSPTAGAVWSLLEEPRSLSSLIDKLAGRFDAPRDRIAADVGSLLADLIRRGWVDEVPGA